MRHIHTRLTSLLLALAGAAGAASGQALSDAFTYQGEVRDANVPVSGALDLQFTLWDAAAGGTQIGLAQTALGASILEGRFTAMINVGGEFGPSAFNGQRRWLEVAVRDPGGVFVTMVPRQEVTAGPYALFATNASTLGGLPGSFYLNAANLAGTLADTSLSVNVPRLNTTNTFASVTNLTNAANTIAGNGAGLTALNATSVASGTLPDARLSTNVALRSAPQTFTGANTFSNANNSFVGNSFAGNGAGLTGLNASSLFTGTVSDARLSANVPLLGVANTFVLSNTFTSTAFFSSGIGVGSTLNPAFRMQLNGGSGPWRGAIAAGGTTNAAVLGELSNTAVVGGHNAALNAWAPLAINPTGTFVGIGTFTPATTLHVAAGTDASLSGGGYLMTGSTSSINLIIDNNEILARNNGAASPLFLNQGGGHVIVPVLEITGGSDVAEPYHIAASNGVEPMPGMVVAIDPDHVGRMRVVAGAYDRTVAGIISGANGIRPGITLTQAGTVADGDMPVASIGRVWCWCDADAAGPIAAGDMLTTSDTPGHAMRVTDHNKAQGATLGKAMSSLKDGKGLVLVLVSLQ